MPTGDRDPEGDRDPVLFATIMTYQHCFDSVEEVDTYRT